MKRFISIIILALLGINSHAQWVLEGPTPYSIGEIYGIGNNIIYIVHNDDTILIKEGNNPYQILKQKRARLYYFIISTIIGFRFRTEGFDGILERTKDGGFNWTEMYRRPYDQFDPQSMVFVNDTTGYFLTWRFNDSCINTTGLYNAKLVISKFCNGTMKYLFSECIQGYSASDLYFTNENIGYFISDYQDSLKIQHNTELRRTIDAGKTWQIVDFWTKYDTIKPIIYNYIKAIDNIVFVHSDYYYLSTDWGNTWEKMSNLYYIHEFLDTIKTWGKNKNDKSLYFTKDLGKTWTIDTSEKNYSWNVKCSSSEFCYSTIYHADQTFELYYYFVNHNPISSVKDEKITEKDNLTIYNNSGSLTFVLKDATNGNIVFSLYNIVGKLLLTDILHTDKNGNLTYNLPLNNFIKGVYIASFSFQGKYVTKKIIIQ